MQIGPETETEHQAKDDILWNLKHEKFPTWSTNLTQEQMCWCTE